MIICFLKKRIKKNMKNVFECCNPVLIWRS